MDTIAREQSQTLLLKNHTLTVFNSLKILFNFELFSARNRAFAW